LRSFYFLKRVWFLQPSSIVDESITNEAVVFVFQTKDREVDFDVEIAIKVCRQASPDDALTLAEKHRKHDWYLKIQTEDHGRYKEALAYITKLEFEEVSDLVQSSS